jgi:hypothetical protein
MEAESLLSDASATMKQAKPWLANLRKFKLAACSPNAKKQALACVLSL